MPAVQETLDGPKDVGPVYGGWLGKYNSAIEQRAQELQTERATRQVERDFTVSPRPRRKDTGR